jgi:hypothetical protein
MKNFTSMNTTNFLIPNKFKLPGWCILIPSSVAGLLLNFKGFEHFMIETKAVALYHHDILAEGTFFNLVSTNLTPTMLGCLIIIGALMVGFSKEKTEDEFIANLRLSSLLWAVLVNYSLLLLSFLFVYGEVAFLTVMTYNMFTTLFIYLIRFNYLLYKSAKATLNEKHNQSTAGY